MNDHLSARAVEASLRGRFGRPLRVVETTGSTNEDALQWSQQGAPEGALVVADHQRQGRGRHGRRWLSRPGGALLFSLVLRPSRAVDEIELLTTALGVACAEGIESVTRLRGALKWPNDVTVDGYKLAGILVESRLEGARVDAVVAGVGVNVSWPEERISSDELNATSIAAEIAGSARGEIPSRAALLGHILTGIESAYDSLAHEEARRDLMRRAAERSLVLGREIQVRLADGGTVSGRAESLTESGALAIDTSGGTIVVRAGEVEGVRPA